MGRICARQERKPDVVADLQAANCSAKLNVIDAGLEPQVLDYLDLHWLIHS
jgi:hypothetical protein